MPPKEIMPFYINPDFLSGIFNNSRARVYPNGKIRSSSSILSAVIYSRSRSAVFWGIKTTSDTPHFSDWANEVFDPGHLGVSTSGLHRSSFCPLFRQYKKSYTPAHDTLQISGSSRYHQKDNKIKIFYLKTFIFILVSDIIRI